MATLVPIFRVRFPEFGTIETNAGAVPDARIQMYLDDAALFLTDYVTCLGAKLDFVAYYLAAHYLSINKQFDLAGNPISQVASNQGALKRIKIDQIEKEYNYTSSTTSNKGDNALLSSDYGKVVWDNIKSCPASYAAPAATIISLGAVTI